MSEMVDRLNEARTRMMRGGKHAADLRRQVAKNGGLTDAEIYAITHLEALIALYKRAGIGTEKEETELREVRAYAQRIKSGGFQYGSGTQDADVGRNYPDAGRDRDC